VQDYMQKNENCYSLCQIKNRKILLTVNSQMQIRKSIDEMLKKCYISTRKERVPALQGG